jgi:hypothetical protein
MPHRTAQCPCVYVAAVEVLKFVWYDANRKGFRGAYRVVVTQLCCFIADWTPQGGHQAGGCLNSVNAAVRVARC